MCKVLLRKEFSKENLFIFNYEMLKKNAEIQKELEKKLKKIQLETIFDRGNFFHLNMILNDTKFGYFNINRKKLKQEISDKLNIKNDDFLELEISKFRTISYNLEKENYILKFDKDKEIEIHLNKILNN
jgi:hypothetical protein